MAIDIEDMFIFGIMWLSMLIFLGKICSVVIKILKVLETGAK